MLLSRSQGAEIEKAPEGALCESALPWYADLKGCTCNSDLAEASLPAAVVNIGPLTPFCQCGVEIAGVNRSRSRSESPALAPDCGRRFRRGCRRDRRRLGHSRRTRVRRPPGNCGRSCMLRHAPGRSCRRSPPEGEERPWPSRGPLEGVRPERVSTGRAWCPTEQGFPLRYAERGHASMQLASNARGAFLSASIEPTIGFRVMSA